MKLNASKKETIQRFKLDCTKEEEEKLCKIAIEGFSKDRRAQLEYAICSLMEEYIKSQKKEVKYGNKDNNRK